MHSGDSRSARLRRARAGRHLTASSAPARSARRGRSDEDPREPHQRHRHGEEQRLSNLSQTGADGAPGRARALPLLALLLPAVAAFALYKIGYLGFAAKREVTVPWFFALSCALALAGSGLRYRDVHPAYALLLRGITVSLGVYIAGSWAGFGAFATGPHALPAQTLALGRWLSLAAVAASLARPAFAIVPCTYVLVAKDATRHILDLPTLTRTDYLPLVEVGLFLSFGLLVWRVFEAAAPRSPWRTLERLRLPADQATLALFLTSCAIHFGNYFWSAMAKLQLQGGPLTWVLENETHLLLATTYATGHLPFGTQPELVRAAFAVLGACVMPLNITVLLAQLASVVAIARVRWAMLMTAFYDLTHVVIFLVSGIFFWKWIALNTVLVFALGRTHDADIPHALRVIAATMVVGGTLVFFAARLGWYDTRALNDQYFVAETRDGGRYRVPTNFFLGASVTLAQHRMGELSAHVFPTKTWATTLSDDVRRGARDCAALPVAAAPANAAAEAHLQRFMRRHHAQTLAMTDARGRLPYDLYPHHVFSNPFSFTAFRQLDLRTIVRYHYVIEAKCVQAGGDPLSSSVRAHYELAIPVAE